MKESIREGVQGQRETMIGSSPPPYTCTCTHKRAQGREGEEEEEQKWRSGEEGGKKRGEKGRRRMKQ